jgi:hypothetical protein
LICTFKFHLTVFVLCLLVLCLFMLLFWLVSSLARVLTEFLTELLVVRVESEFENSTEYVVIGVINSCD